MPEGNTTNNIVAIVKTFIYNGQFTIWEPGVAVQKRRKMSRTYVSARYFG